MAIIVDIVEPVETGGEVQGEAAVIEVVVGTETPLTTTTASSVVSVVEPGGTVANVQWGYEFPASPTEGQIFLKVSP